MNFMGGINLNDPWDKEQKVRHAWFKSIYKIIKIVLDKIVKRLYYIAWPK